jgi:hypothetical protein
MLDGLSNRLAEVAAGSGVSFESRRFEASTMCLMSSSFVGDASAERNQRAPSSRAVAGRRRGRGSRLASLRTFRPLSGCTSRLLPSSKSSRKAPIWRLEALIESSSTTHWTGSVKGGVVRDPE